MSLTLVVISKRVNGDAVLGKVFTIYMTPVNKSKNVLNGRAVVFANKRKRGYLFDRSEKFEANPKAFDRECMGSNAGLYFEAQI